MVAVFCPSMFSRGFHFHVLIVCSFLKTKNNVVILICEEKFYMDI